MSSGESEFYAIVKGAGMGIQTRQIFEAAGMPVEVEIKSDSSAARGICGRQGSGSKLRHLSMKELWVQEHFRMKMSVLSKVGTLDNWADLGTKVLDKPRLDQLVEMMPITRREGLIGL